MIRRPFNARRLTIDRSTFALSSSLPWHHSNLVLLLGPLKATYLVVSLFDVYCTRSTDRFEIFPKIREPSRRRIFIHLKVTFFRIRENSFKHLYSLKYNTFWKSPLFSINIYINSLCVYIYTYKHDNNKQISFENKWDSNSSSFI